MTRDEAIARIKARHKKLPWPITDDDIAVVADCDLDCYVALGMLKLDEQKSAEERFTELSVNQGRSEGFAANVLQILDLAGLRIVSK